MIRAEIKFNDKTHAEWVRKLCEGKVAILYKTEWDVGDYLYVLNSFEDEETDIKFWWQMEQIPSFGTYPRYKDFLKDYKTGKYTPRYSAILREEDFEILEEINE